MLGQRKMEKNLCLKRDMAKAGEIGSALAKGAGF